MAKKKMSTGKKVAIGTGVVAVIGAILCYFFCPCFKKEEELEDVYTGDSYDAGGTMIPPTLYPPTKYTAAKPPQGLPTPMGTRYHPAPTIII